MDKVAVVIPARDEEATIERAVRSLGAQDYPGELRVFVVDDHSGDRTAEIARESGAAVISAAPLEPGWTGKMWAVSQGLAAAMEWRPDYVLLTDADVEHAPDNVRSLVARAGRDGLDLASYMVRLENRNFAERFAIPAFVFFFLLVYPPWKARAAGGCMLVRAAALERIGGVDSIRGEIIDDCALAARVRQAGGRTWMGLTSTTRSLRRYHGFGEIARMIARTAFSQLRYSVWLLLATVAAMIIVLIVPPVAALTGSIAGAVVWALIALAYVPMLRFYRQSLLWAPALPFVGVFYAGVTVWSAMQHWSGKGGAWKGRTYP